MTGGSGAQTWWSARNMTLDSLISFLAVVEFEGFGRAAQALHRSQSRVSTHVSELERALGAPLFDRRTRPTALTDTGEAFAEHVRAALGHLESGTEHVRALIDVEQGEVRIGSYASASIGFVPGVLAEFTGRYPKVQVVLHEAGVRELEEVLLEGEVGLAVRPVQPERLHRDLAEESLWREEMQLVLPADHPAAGERDPAGDDDAVARLLGDRVISVGNPRRRSAMAAESLDTDVVLERAGVDRSRVLYTQHPQAVVAMVVAGLGVGVVNGLALATSDTGGVVVRPVLQREVHRDVALCWHRQRYHSAAERRMMEIVRAAPAPPGTRSLRPMGPAAPAV
ncbi:LysR family transcriptional regulator [Pseudonocardia nematodicida]|uniref:LysR family transcriptional regulator n=1 Tax=Pseudonocardia nematodicida TaxID=1206997 RepID=A0ABV1KJZ1_9PSEU